MRKLIVFSAATALTLGVSAGPVSANPDDTMLKAKLRPCCAEPEPAAEGMAKHKVRNDPDDLREKFKGKVEVPYPNVTFGLETEEGANAADVRLILSREGIDYAECFLELDADDLGEGEAEYQAKIRFKDGEMEVKKGACDVDLATEGIQSGIPIPEEGDLAVGSIDGVDVVDGTFVLKH